MKNIIDYSCREMSSSITTSTFGVEFRSVSLRSKVYITWNEEKGLLNQ